jgi:hypothetical protein
MLRAGVVNYLLRKLFQKQTRRWHCNFGPDGKHRTTETKLNLKDLVRGQATKLHRPERARLFFEV